MIRRVSVLFLALLAGGIVLGQDPGQNAPAQPGQDSELLQTTIQRIMEGPGGRERTLRGQTSALPAGQHLPWDEFHPDRETPSQPHDGGEVRQRIDVEPRALQSWVDNSAMTDEICAYVMNSLLGIDAETWEWYGVLAETWEVEDVVELFDGETVRGHVEESENTVRVRGAGDEVREIERGDVSDIRRGTAFTFHLRHGVHFHNGMPFTARDVEFTYKVLKNPHCDIPEIQGYYQDLTSCEVLDDYTVRMTYGKQYWRAIDFVGGFSVMPRDAWDPDGLIDSDPEAFGRAFRDNEERLQHPIGTGPYKFAEWQRGVQIILERNDDYFAPERAPRHLDRLIFKIIVDETAALQAMKSGDIDFLYRIPVEMWLETQQEEQYRDRFCFVEAIYPTYGYIGWNLRRPLFQDVRVRWALSLGCCDMEAFIDDVLHGKAIRVTHDQFWYGRAANHALKPIPFDLETAQALLREAGWWDSDNDGLIDKDGQPFRFTLYLPQSAQTHPQVRFATIMQENLRRLGIDMQQQMIEWGTLLDRIDRHDFDAVRIAWAFGNPPNESDPYQIWHSSQAVEHGSNHVGFIHEEMDHLIEQSRQELDVGRRSVLQNRISEIIYRNQPYTFMYTPEEHRIYSRRFRGVKISLLRPGYDLTEWYVDEDSR